MHVHPMKGSAKRWLILTQYYSPEIGAPQIRLRSLARELHGCGLEVEVLTAMPNYPKGKIFSGYRNRWKLKEDIDGIPVTRVWLIAGTGKSAFVRLANYLSFTISSLMAALMLTRPDILFVESQPLSLGIVAIFMKWFRGVPYIYNVPDLQIDVAQQLGFMKNRAFLKLSLILENYFLRHSWKVSTVTHRFIDHFKERGLSKEKITFFTQRSGYQFFETAIRMQEIN